VKKKKKFVLSSKEKHDTTYMLKSMIRLWQHEHKILGVQFLFEHGHCFAEQSCDTLVSNIHMCIHMVLSSVLLGIYASL
jgi:hypothetical protein